MKQNRKSISNIFQENVEKFYMFNGKDLLGSSSGLKTVDKATEGFFGLTCLTGVPGRGKTTFAIQTVAYNVFTLKKPVIYCTLEVNKQMFISKLTSFLANVPMKKILKGNLNLEESERVLEAYRKIYYNDKLILLDSEDTSFNSIKNQILKIKKEYNERGEEISPLVVLDYLNIFYDYGEDAISSMDTKDKIARQMAEFIKLKNETKTNFIIIAAKNKQGYGTAEMSSLKGTNDLEYGFETILSLEDVHEEFPVSNYPANPKTGFVEVNTLMYIMKNRWGDAKKNIPLDFSGAEGRFKEPL